MDRREHHRAHLQLPVRLRWNTPLRQRTEVTKTLDISRSGLLVPSQEQHEPGTSLWVTFPYDASVGDGQPEIAARVVRSAVARNGAGNGREADRATPAKSSNGRALALQFLEVPALRGNGGGHRPEIERRRSLRRPSAVPIRVRSEHVPWFEETMTIDVSAAGLRFSSTREYPAGEVLLVSFEPTASAAWPGGVEIRARVVRNESLGHGPALAIAVCRADSP